MCKGIVGLILGHNYKPEITKAAAKMPDSLTQLSGTMKVFNNFRDETFHGLICTRCGDIKKCWK